MGGEGNKVAPPQTGVLYSTQSGGGPSPGPLLEVHLLRQHCKLCVAECFYAAGFKSDASCNQLSRHELEAARRWPSCCLCRDVRSAMRPVKVLRLLRQECNCMCAAFCRRILSSCRFQASWLHRHYIDRALSTLLPLFASTFVALCSICMNPKSIVLSLGQ